jgi:hypothetical protein
MLCDLQFVGLELSPRLPMIICLLLDSLQEATLRTRPCLLSPEMRASGSIFTHGVCLREERTISIQLDGQSLLSSHESTNIFRAIHMGLVD